MTGEGMTRGQKIRAARKAAGMSQRKLGEIAGVTARTVMRWENDATTASAEHLTIIADALGIDLADIDGIS